MKLAFAAQFVYVLATAELLIDQPQVGGPKLIESGIVFEVNTQPVIGIVAMPLEKSMTDPMYEGYSAYMMEAYVTFMEAAGARVVPLVIGEDEQVTLDKLSKLSGVLFPGGGGHYTDFSSFIMDRLVEYNDAGHFYPAWGTCLGFENLVKWASDLEYPLTQLQAHKISLPLDFTVDPQTTKMFSSLGEKAYFFEQYPLTLNSHSWGVAPELFETDAGLKSKFFPTSVSYSNDEEQLPFVASMESADYPFYGT